MSELVDNQIRKAKQNGREIGRQEAFDEVVADSMESMLSDENAAAFLEKLAKRDKGLKEKVVSWLKELAEKLKNAMTAYKDVKPDSTEGKMVSEMEDFRKEIMGIYTSALVDAGENFRENGGNKKATLEGVRLQERQGGYDYSKPFDQQIDDWLKMDGPFPQNDTLLVGRTPKVLLDIGVPALPVTIAQKNLRETLLGQYKGSPQEIADHLISPEDMKSIPEKIANPVAIIADRRLVRNKWTVSESTIDVLIEMKINGKNTLVPVQITGTAKQHGMTIDANAILSVHGNKDTMQRLWYAVTNDTDENIMVFFADKN
ncbi:MAG: hypothetical protein PUD38_06190 [Firmicutes bacterium]|nr:hypothetical protein [Bacillota bacterium]